MVEQLTLNQLVRGSSPRPATSGISFSQYSGFRFYHMIPQSHVGRMAAATITVVRSSGFEPVKTIGGKAEFTL